MMDSQRKADRSHGGRRPEGARLAYLVNQYPKASHTFIRREIVALEKLGIAVRRVSIRSTSEELVEPADQAERARTHVCLDQPRLRLALAAAAHALSSPGAFVRAIVVALSMHRRSERGLLRHLAYLVEALYLARLFGREGILHVHVHFGTNAAAVARLVQVVGGPGYSLTIHGPGEFDAPVGLSLGAKVAEARFVAAISHYCSAQVMRWARIEDWSKIAIVRCAVDAAFFDARAPIDSASELLVTVGRLTPQKGQFLLLEAFEEVLRRHPKARLLLVGDGELRPRLEEAIRARGLEGRARITGWMSEQDVRAAILSSRAFALPSFAEGLPVVLMEALALGRPVIATGIAGVPELVRHGEGGWLVGAGDRADLAEAMNAALDATPRELEAMAAAGSARVGDRHRIERTASDLAALLRPWLVPAEPDGSSAPGTGSRARPGRFPRAR